MANNNVIIIETAIEVAEEGAVLDFEQVDFLANDMETLVKRDMEFERKMLQRIASMK